MLLLRDTLNELFGIVWKPIALNDFSINAFCPRGLFLRNAFTYVNLLKFISLRPSYATTNLHFSKFKVESIADKHICQGGSLNYQIGSY